MATATSEVQAANLLFPRTRIADPLHQLQRGIRAYVFVEGLAWLAIFACLWFWGTLLVDYGMFRLFGLDYLREGSTAFVAFLRGAFLGSFLVGLGVIAYAKLYRRLRAAFTPSGLAMVLERRFPGILGDRLVTAVELGDPDKAGELGFSPALLDDTVQAAVDRLGQLTLGQVFNWRRIVWTCLLALGLLVTASAVFAIATDVIATWAARDLFVQRAFWPRDVLLDLPDFKVTDVRAVPQGGDFRLTFKAHKWVVRAPRAEEGWRPLTWSDVPSDAPSANVPWELLDGLPVGLADILPTEWYNLPIDDLEARLAHLKSREGLEALGTGTIQYLSARVAGFPGNGSLPTSFRTLRRQLLPATIQDAGDDVVRQRLATSARLRHPELKRLEAALRGDGFLSADAAQAFVATLAPLRPPVFAMGTLQRLAEEKSVAVAGFAFTPDDLELLPDAWRGLPVKSLPGRLQEYQNEESPERYGERARVLFMALFDALDERAAMTSLATRKGFRRLEVPEQVVVEFEQLLTEEERTRGKPRLGRPTVRRQLDGNDYVYEFKKVDRPLRFRIVAGRTVTPWLRLDVKPLPVLTRLVRTQEELGYLHGSNEPVPVGPINVGLDGDESTVEVPSGTRVTLAGDFSKTIERLQALLPEIDAPHPAVVDLARTPSNDGFTLQLHALANEEARFRLVFDDADGIRGVRRIHVRVAADREPEFKKAQYVLVNRKMITPAAVIPFVGHVQDDRGLTELTYEVSVETPERKVARRILVPFRRFLPLQAVDPLENVAFEKRTQVSLGRLLMGPGWEARVVSLAAATAPAGTLGSATLPPAFQAAFEHVFDYKPRPGNAPVLQADDEFFDTLLLRQPTDPGQPRDAAPLPAALPYRLVVRLLATDNRVKLDEAGQPVVARQTSRSPEAFEFQVVHENDLLIEVGKREEDLRESCERVIENVKDGRRGILKRLQGDAAGGFKSEKENVPYDFRRAVADAQDVVRLLRENRDGLDRNVVQPFRDVWRELVLNRCRTDVVERIDKKICRPLEAIIQPGQHFARAEDATEALARGLDAEKDRLDREVVRTAVERVDQLLGRLDEILGEMKKLLEFNEAVKALQDLIRAQEAVNKELERKQKEAKKKELDD